MADSYVCSGATLKCSMGYTPCVLKVIGRNVCLAGQPPMANIMDYKVENIPSFCLCHLTDPFPKPCKPIIDNAWVGGENDYTICNQPALLKSSQCFCKNGGVIQIIDDGQKGESPSIEKQPIEDFSEADKKDRLVLEDTYWIKNTTLGPLEIRFVPHQMKVDLYLIFTFEHDGETGYTKENVVFKLFFDIPETHYSQEEPIIIDSSDVLGHILVNNKGEIVKRGGRTCYYCIIKDFSPDLTTARLRKEAI